MDPGFPDDEITGPDTSVGSQQQPAAAPLGRGFREKRPSVLLRDFVTTSVLSMSPPLPHRLRLVPQVLLIL